MWMILTDSHIYVFVISRIGGKYLSPGYSFLEVSHSHLWICSVTHENASAGSHIYSFKISWNGGKYLRPGYGLRGESWKKARKNERKSCHTCVSIVSHMWMSLTDSHLFMYYLANWRELPATGVLRWRWVLARMWLRCVTHVDVSNIFEWVSRMRHVTHIDGCNIFEWVVAQKEWGMPGQAFEWVMYHL